MTPLAYRSTPYQRACWRAYALDPTVGLQQAEPARAFPRWPDFCAELYHALYAAAPDPVLEAEAAEGAAPYRRMAEAIAGLPEVADLRARTVGNEWWAGIGAAALAEAAYAAGREVAPGADPAAAARAEAMVQRALEQAPGDPALQEALQEAHAAYGDAQDRTGKAAVLLDAGAVRQAARRASRQASEDIDALGAAAAALGAGWGAGAHDGRRLRGVELGALASRLQANPRLRRVAALAGRLQRIARERQAAKPRRGTSEVAGVELGADLARLVPAEAVVALDPDLEALFAARLAERRLACWELHDRPREAKGPIIALVDCSGSMAGDPHAWACAVALALCQVAQAQGRAFALVYFGTAVLGTHAFRRGERRTAAEVQAAVEFFASSGGTDFGPPLAEARRIQAEDGLREADVVLITDGEAALPPGVAAWKAATGSRLFALLVGRHRAGRPDLQAGADRTWALADVLDDAAALDLFGEV